MFDDLHTYFNVAVLTSYAEYARIRDGDLSGTSKHMRAALGLAAYLFHFREHVPAPNQLSRAQAAQQCPDYRLIADVTNVSKHATLTRPTSEGPPLVSDADDIAELSVVTLYEDAEGQYSDTQIWVMVRCADGKDANLDGALINVLNFWGAELKRIGVLSTFNAFSLPTKPGSQFVPRAKARNMNLEAIQGVRFLQTIRLQKFNDSIGASEPMDVSGSKLEWRLCKLPPLNLLLEFTPRGATQPLKVELTLTDEEALQFKTLQTDLQRNEFIRKLTVDRSAEIRAKYIAAKPTDI
jgi:hypothetical protein